MEWSYLDLLSKTHEVVPTGRPWPAEVSHALTWLHDRFSLERCLGWSLTVVVWKKMKVAIHRIIVETLTGIVCKLVCTLKMYTCWKDLFTPGCVLQWRNIDNEIVTSWLSLSTARLGATSGEWPTEHYGWWHSKGCRYPFLLLLFWWCCFKYLSFLWSTSFIQCLEEFLFT